MEQIIFKSTADSVFMQNAEGYTYADSLANFVLDGGKIEEGSVIDYNKTFGVCFVNGGYSAFPNAVVEENLEAFAVIKQNKERRIQESLPKPSEAEVAEMKLAKAKAERADAVSKLTVTVDGMVFDADETSQNRMSRVVSGAQALGVDLNTTTQIWVLADNTVATPTVAQLAQALKLAGEAQSALWIVPYQTETTEPTAN